MARIINGDIHNLSGRLGKIVFKKFNDELYAYSRPNRYKKTKCPKARIHRDSFGFISKFAKFINLQPLLKSIWKQSSIKGFSAYHKILKTNLHLTTDQQLGESNIIVPNTKPSPITGLTLNLPATISLSINKSSEHILSTTSYNSMFQFIFAFSKLQGKKLERREIICNRYPLSDVTRDDKSTFSFKLQNETKTALNSYTDLNIYVTLIYQKGKSKKLYWFSTYAKSFQLTARLK